MNGRREPLQHAPDHPTIRTLLYLLFGPIVWALHLTLVYGVQSVACAVAGPGLRPLAGGLDPVQLTILAATAAALLALAGGWRGLANPGGAMSEGVDERSHFIVDTMRLLLVLSALGIIAAGSATLVLPTCADLR